jgi:hypothetical protein
MIVMTNTTRRFPAPKTVPSVLHVKPLQIGEDPNEVSLAAERIRAGEAFLKVVEYPWGVEFEVCGREGEK